jgi:hypothetical protein
MTAGPPVISDPMTGRLILPGRVTRQLTDPQTTAALPSWLQLAGGSLGSMTWTVSTSEPPGSLSTTTPVGSPFTSGVKGAGVLASIAPFRFTALAVTFEGLCYDADSGFGTSVGFFPAAASKGGAWVEQLAGETQAGIAVNDSTATKQRTNIQYQLFGGGSLGVRRRNLTLLWLIHDGWVYLMEDDQVFAAQDVSATADIGDNCYPALFITSTNSTQHYAQFSQSKILLNHN